MIFVNTSNINQYVRLDKLLPYFSGLQLSLVHRFPTVLWGKFCSSLGFKTHDSLVILFCLVLVNFQKMSLLSCTVVSMHDAINAENFEGNMNITCYR